MQAVLGNHQFTAPTMDPFEAFASSDPAAPAPPPARIRPFNPDDLKLTRYLVGAAVMEPYVPLPRSTVGVVEQRGWSALSRPRGGSPGRAWSGAVGSCRHKSNSQWSSETIR